MVVREWKISMICALPDDLLLQILHRVPTKDAIATSILSQRWRYVWMSLPSLEFKDEGISESVGCFIEKSLQLHKAPRLDSLIVELGPHYPVDVDVGEWVENAVNRGVELLDFKLLWTAEPRRFPKSLYTCETLYELSLSNQILVDVSFPARLPSLKYLTLDYVVYKDEDSLHRLLSSSHVLKSLTVRRRHKSDNLKTFTVKVSSLEELYYTSILPQGKVDGDVVEEDEVDDGEEEEDEDEVDDSEEEEEDEVDDSEEEEEDEVEDGEENEDDLIESLVIDSPALRVLYLWDLREHYCLIENMHRLDWAFINFLSDPEDKFLRYLSSVIHLNFLLTKSMVACCYAIKFPRLIEFYFFPNYLVDWLEPLVFFLQNSPKLKTLTIDTTRGAPSPSWNQPSTVPECLSNHLEVFRWKKYGGREGEKKLLTYILANSKCVKTVEISFIATCNNLKHTRKEIESMPTTSESCQLLFSTQMKCMFKGMEICSLP